MAAVTRYPTKPIDSWSRMEELNKLQFEHTWAAHDKGDLVIFGLGQWFHATLAGLGNYANPGLGTYLYDVMDSSEKAVRLFETLESKGYAREICSRQRCHLAQMLTGMSMHGPQGQEVKPDFIFQTILCKSVGKIAQIAGAELGIPCYIVDHPGTDRPATREYLLHQLLDAIDWFEKVTGRKYDDEKLIEAAKIEWDSSVTWARICELTKNIPTPLDARQIWSLRQPIVTIRHRRECLDYLKELYDETKDRVARGISARGFEERRLMHEGVVPFYWSDQILALPEKYGAVFVMADVMSYLYGAWHQLEDGSIVAAPTLKERGWDIKTREDALKAEIDLGLSYWATYGPLLDCQTTRPLQTATKSLDWSLHGVVFTIDRSCHTDNGGMLERKAAVQQAGIPTMIYEASGGDIREIDKVQVEERFDAFMESLGLTPILDSKATAA